MLCCQTFSSFACHIIGLVSVEQGCLSLHIFVAYLTQSGHRIHCQSLIVCWLSHLLHCASDLWWSVIVVAVLGCWLVRYHIVLRGAGFSAYNYLRIFHFLTKLILTVTILSVVHILLWPWYCICPYTLASVALTSGHQWLQVSQGCSAVVPCWRPLPDGRRRGSTSSTFGLVTISGCAPYAAGDRAFLVAASRVWNSLPHHVTSAQSLPVFRCRLKTHLFKLSFPWLYCCVREVTLVIMDTLIVAFTYLLTITWFLWH